ncbi:MAG: peptide chain release factor N(5)-glutamine methyltransferase [Patescibacteria group bacterium]|nr:peptide chain release factor N(5)-glutamine methyltransferase [Patescibacteria group bacterium]
MKVKEALKKYHAIEIELLLEKVLGKSKEFIFLHPEKKLSSYQVSSLSRLIKRRQKGEPIAYILGYKDFYGLRFKVNRNVLIPRPETEMAVGLAIERLIERLGKPIKILDVGTGSGCIIISLAKALSARGHLALRKVSPCGEFYGSDISTKALKIAKQNAKTILGKYSNTTGYESICAKIKFIQSDLLANIKFNPEIIIANLPYGWTGWENNTSEETKGLKFEPKSALFTKDHGLYHIRRLLKQVAEKKQKPRLMFLEFDPRQKQELEKLIKKHLPEGDIRFYRDFNGFWRYVEIKNK